MKDKPSGAKPVFRGVFLDRDGVINREHGYVRSANEFEMLPGVAEAISNLNRRGVKVAILTNQSGIARGYFSEDDLDRIHTHMRALLAQKGARIDHILYAPWLDKPDLTGGVQKYLQAHEDRKPNPGMLLKACRYFCFSPLEVCYVGDSYRDLQAATRAGIEFFGIRSAKVPELAGKAEIFESLLSLVTTWEKQSLLPVPPSLRPDHLATGSAHHPKHEP